MPFFIGNVRIILKGHSGFELLPKGHSNNKPNIYESSHNIFLFISYPISDQMVPFFNEKNIQTLN